MNALTADKYNISVFWEKCKLSARVEKSAGLCYPMKLSGIRRETASDLIRTVKETGIKLKIGIIGAGKVGVTLGKYFSVHGIPVSGFFSRTRKSADEAATYTGTAVYQSITELVTASDVLFVTTPDREIVKIWQQLKSCDIHDYIICHFSGSLSSHVFSGIKETGAYGLSIHPMYAFSDKFQAYRNLKTAYLTMEGDEKAISVMKPVWERLGHPVMTIDAGDKVKYHAAAVMASNEMLGLIQTSVGLLTECGFEEETAMAFLTPLIRRNIDTALEKGCVHALTGPVERNDTGTVRKHLEALSGGDGEEVYRSLGIKTLELAQRKNPSEDYREMRAVFEGKNV